MNTTKTVLHAYHFNMRVKGDAEAFAALKLKLKADGLKCFETHGGGTHWLQSIDGKTLDLETEHLFSNQWNTAPIGDAKSGLRVFDWAQDYRPNNHPSIKRGHWLEQTSEMREMRRNRMACGYCGKQEPAQKGNVFCPHCIGSEYLKADELHLTRMRAVDDESKRQELTEAERAHLLPIYKEAQLHGHTERDKKRIAEQKAAIESEYKRAIHDATEKRDAARWIMERLPGVLSNWIFYSHTGKHSFGWRNPIDAEILAELLDIISEFPFSYEIKCADGRTLTGGQQ